LQAAHRAELGIVEHHLLPPWDVELWWGWGVGVGGVPISLVLVLMLVLSMQANARLVYHAPCSLSDALTRSLSCQWCILVGRSV